MQLEHPISSNRSTLLNHRSSGGVSKFWTTLSAGVTMRYTGPSPDLVSQLSSNATETNPQINNPTVATADPSISQFFH